MKLQIAVWLVGATVVITTIGVTMARLRRPAEIKVEVAHVEPRSCIQILRNDDQLRNAYRRSADFERRAAKTLLARADRYEAQIMTAPLAVIPMDDATSTQCCEAAAASGGFHTRISRHVLAAESVR